MLGRFGPPATVAIVAVQLAAGAASGAPLYAQPATGVTPSLVRIYSLVGDPLHPTTLYIGGTVAKPNAPGNWNDYDYGY